MRRPDKEKKKANSLEWKLELALNPRVEVMKKTQDDWYPCFNEDEVRLTFHGVINGYKDKELWVWRVSCWGNDDFGIDKDFHSSKEAKEVFDMLNEMDMIQHKTLFDMGFARF